MPSEVLIFRGEYSFPVDPITRRNCFDDNAMEFIEQGVRGRIMFSISLLLYQGPKVWNSPLATCSCSFLDLLVLEFLLKES